jgi:hypothetical protein
MPENGMDRATSGRSERRFRPSVVRVMLREGKRFVGVRFYGIDADGSHVDTTGYALRLIDEDEQRLGRPRARSGAERILREAGFPDPGRAYAFAMDRRSRDARAAA